MSESDSQKPLFLVTLQFDTPDLVMDVPEDGLRFLHPNGVKVLLGYEPGNTPAVMTETDHDDEELLRLIESAKPGTEPSEDDPRISAFMEEVRTSHRRAANDIVSNLRWVVARPGGHKAVGRRQRSDYRVRGGDWQHLPMRPGVLLTGISGRLRIDDEWRRAIQEATIRGWEEPLAHVILREAKTHIDGSPRSALVIMMTAVETGLKQQANRLPKLKPSGQGKTTKGLPWTGGREAVRGDVGDLLRRVHRIEPTRWINLPNWAATRLDTGRDTRNAVVHEGKQPPGREELLALARLVQDILYLLDYQAGHDWAEQYIGYQHGQGDMVFGHPVYYGEMSED